MIPRHEGATLNIVGKGPSLASLSAGDFAEGPVLTINQSVEHVLRLGVTGPVYSMQKDGCLAAAPGRCVETCDEPFGCSHVPDSVHVLLNDKESSNCYPGHPLRIVFSAEEWFGNRFTPSAPCAARIARLMGVSHVRLLCFDAMEGDSRTLEPWGVQSYGDDYMVPNQRMMNELDEGGITYEVVIPHSGD